MPFCMLATLTAHLADEPPMNDRLPAEPLPFKEALDLMRVLKGVFHTR